MRSFIIFLLFPMSVFCQSLERGGTGCPDNFCIWAIGAQFGSNPVLYIYEDSAAKYLITRYSKDEMGITTQSDQVTQSLSLKLSTALEMDTLERQGLYLKILNTDNNSFSNIIRVIREAPPSPQVTSNPVQPLQIGGTNYVVYNLGDYLQNPDTWGDPVRGVKMTYARYDENKETVNNHIYSIFLSGQNKISTMLWYVIYPQAPQSVHMHTIDVSSGLSLRHQNNIREVLEQIRLYPFEEVFFRLAPQGNEMPLYWTQWNEGNYQTQWRAIQQIIDIVEEVFSNSQTRVTYDLSGENAGLENIYARQFITRLWRDFVDKYGIDKSYGMSTAYYPGRIKSYVQDLDASGRPRPKRYAVDIYNSKSMDGEFYRLAKELKEIGESNKEIVLQETYYNNGNVKLAVDRARSWYGLNITSINQWNLQQSGASGMHFSTLDPSRYSAYLERYGQPSLSGNVGCRGGESQCFRIVGGAISRNAQVIIMDGRGTKNVLRVVTPSDYTYETTGKAVYIQFRVHKDIWTHYYNHGLTLVVKDKYELESAPIIVNPDGSYQKLLGPQGIIGY